MTKIRVRLAIAWPSLVLFATITNALLMEAHKPQYGSVGMRCYRRRCLLPVERLPRNPGLPGIHHCLIRLCVVCIMREKIIRNHIAEMRQMQGLTDYLRRAPAYAGVARSSASPRTRRDPLQMPENDTFCRPPSGLDFICLIRPIFRDVHAVIVIFPIQSHALNAVS
jgi:hypothetical protein